MAKKNGATSNSTTLGQRLRARRGNRHLEELKVNAKVSVAYLSQIERDLLPIKEETLRRVINAYDPEDPIFLQDCLNDFRKTKVLSTHPDYFPSAFANILGKHSHITKKSLASALGDTVSALDRWLTGKSLPSGDTLHQLMAELEERGVPSSQTKELRKAHVYDTVLLDKRLGYLTRKEKETMLRSAFGPPPKK